MSDDSFTVRSSQSWFSRIGGAIMGVLFGLILFIAAFPLLGWNEGRAIKRAKTLTAGSEAVITVPASPVEAANEGKLVHLTGKTAAESDVTDPSFGLTVPAIKLRRNVEMYQWNEDKKSETEKKVGGSEETVTTYTYKKEWSSSVIDSSQFNKPQGHTNPENMAIESETFVADGITVGAFQLPESLIEKIDDFKSLPISKETKTDLSADVPDPVSISGGGFYIGEDPKNPAVGDLKIHFEEVLPGDVSIVAGQVGQTFEPYAIGDLGTIELLQSGTFSAKSMFASEQEANMMLTWLLRLGGFMMMFIGLTLIVKPFAVVADVIPFLGNLADMGIGILALLVALPLTLGTIAIAWLAYRPLLGLPLFLIAITGLVFAVRALLKKRAVKRVVA